MRGVNECELSLLPVAGLKSFKAFSEMQVPDGTTATFIIPDSLLPSEFIIKYECGETSEQHLFVSTQDIELWVDPHDIQDSKRIIFQKNEKENTLYASFTKENAAQKEYLLQYVKGHTKTEFEMKRNEYNAWLASQQKLNYDCFMSKTFQFQYLPPIDSDNEQTLFNHYFDGVNFSDPLIIRTSHLKEWMDKYVNLYGSISSTSNVRDSLFALAGYRAIEKAKHGHPKVYGWMVDYFFIGYETNGMASGLKMLEQYSNDSMCLTTKKQQIKKRLAGLETMKSGIIAPDFQYKNDAGKFVSFHSFKTDCKYKLILFWSADCSHCKELVSKLYLWSQRGSNKKLVTVFALSVDNTDTEIQKWNEATQTLSGWIHYRCEGGINSPEASSYFILSTPIMILVDTKTDKIISLPEKIIDLKNILIKMS